MGLLVGTMAAHETEGHGRDIVTVLNFHKPSVVFPALKILYEVFKKKKKKKKREDTFLKVTTKYCTSSHAVYDSSSNGRETSCESHADRLMESRTYLLEVGRFRVTLLPPSCCVSFLGCIKLH